MSRNYDPSNQGLRSEMRGKRRKTNLILNLLIGLVVLLIVFVSAKIFFGGNDENATDKEVAQEQQTEAEQEEKASSTDENTDSDIAENKENESEEKTDFEKEDNEASTDNNEIEQAEKPEPANEEEAIVTVGGNDGNVKKAIENPSWKPIGTSQTGEHYAVYDKESVDWSEMLQAISYATGVDQSNMNVWFLGNNGFNKSVGTITTKDQQQKYRVYIDWVDGQGWKPTKVEELNEVEKKSEAKKETKKKDEDS